MHKHVLVVKHMLALTVSMACLGCHGPWFCPLAMFAEIQDMMSNFLFYFSMLLIFKQHMDSQTKRCVFSIPTWLLWSHFKVCCWREATMFLPFSTIPSFTSRQSLCPI